MTHRPLEELRQDLLAASGKVQVGKRYTHYKHPEVFYTVTGLAVLEATDEVVVIYSALESGQQISFVRPLTSWLEIVHIDGKVAPRFLLAE